MKIVALLIFLSVAVKCSTAQNATDSLNGKEGGAAADDPSQFFTRLEVFNELQRYKNDVYVNQSILRANLKIGKRFTTRIDIPFVYNSFSSPAGYKQFGLGDISFRLLGYKFMENSRSAITASVEISLNTASSPLLGTGKNLVIPLVTYSRAIPRNKLILALVLQQANAVGGDKERSNISYTKIQAVAVKVLTRKTWAYIAPEWYIDYVNGGLSMNIKGRFVIAPAKRVNIWTTAGAGIFGDFIARYQWSADIGFRYFLFRNKSSRN